VKLKALAAAPESDDLPAPTAVLLGVTLTDNGQAETAVALLRRAAGRHPGDVWVNYSLATALGRVRPLAREEAVRYYTAARALRPETAHNLANLLDDMGRGAEAEAVFRDLTNRQPKNSWHLFSLGQYLLDRSRTAKAAPILDRAIAACRETIRIKPGDFLAHTNLGHALRTQGKAAEAIAAFREAIRLKPDFAEAHHGVGTVLYIQGKLAEAVAEYREAIRLKPDDARPHHGLGNVLFTYGKMAEAIAEYREAIRLDPDRAVAHSNLGRALRSQGDYAGSLAMYRRGHELGSKRPDRPYPSALEVAEAELMAALAARMPAFLKGDDQPKDVHERLAVAQMSYDRKHYAAAARFWSEALAADLKLGENRRIQHRYNAACVAALAAAGAGADAPKPDDDARARLRRQALDQLQAERAAWAKELDSGGAPARSFVRKTLEHWKIDPDLAGVRGPEALAKLPHAERGLWQTLWSEVDSLLARARDGGP
jgi:eukaryotic-like serine/threonine-protein kinase